MNLDDVKRESDRLGPTAFIATAGPDGRPHAVPVVVAWVGDELCTFVASGGRKVRNLRSNPQAAVHWPVSPETDFDGLLVEGPVELVDTVEGRRELWGRMGYDLDAFEPGGPESEGHVFVKIRPVAAVVLRHYGVKGRDAWRAG